MSKNYELVRRLLRYGALATVFSFSLGLGQTFAQTKIEEDFEEHEEENKKRREQYMDMIHRAAPGTDWESKDQIFRINSQSKSKAKVAAGSESFAGGKLSGDWIEKGANNIAGRIRYADYYVSTNNIYAVSDGGNVWKSSDLNGTNWTCLNNSLKLKGAEFIKVIPNGTGKRIFVSTNDKYVYYSDNDGATWNVSTGLTAIADWGWIMKTTVMADAANTIYVLATEWNNAVTVAVYRSTDKGATFTKLRTWNVPNYGSGDDQKKYSIWAPNNASHTSAYLISPDSIFSVASTGTNAVTKLYKHNLPVTNDVRLTGNKSGTSIVLYTATNSTMYRSGNAGSTWIQINAPTTSTPWGQYSISTTLNNPNQIFFGDIEAYKGTVSGSSVTWTKVNDWGDYYANIPTKLHADIPAVITLLNGSGAEFQFICTDGGLYTSTNTLATVSNISLSGLNDAQYYSVYTVKTNPNYVYAGAQDQGFQQATVDNGGVLSFTELNGGDNGRTVSTNSTNFWQTGYSVLYHYPNATNGSSSAWYSLDTVGRLWMPYILEHPTDPNVLYMGGGKTNTSQSAKIQKFTYNGVYGIQQSTLPFDFAPSSGCTNLSAIGISKINNNYWYVLTDNGYFYYSTNGGTSFTMNSTFSGLPGHYFYGSAIYASKTTLGTIYVAGSGYSNPGMYKSTNHGQTFTALTNGLPSTMIFDIVANDDESMIFAATEVGPYVYVVADNAWYSLKGNSGVDQTYWDVEFISSSQIVRYATYGRGIMDFKISTSNQSPTVSITSPLNNATFTTPASVTINATAADADGTISKVEFYQGTTLLNSDAASPFSYTWTNVPTGTYSLTAKAYDNLNATTTSSVISITVSANQAPTVSITAPANNATYTAPASVTINATAADADGTISKVEFYNGATLLNTDNVSPFSYSWTNVAAGTYTLTAKAYDNFNLATTSSVINITVNPAGNSAPTVSLTSPAANAVFNAPGSVTISANASDADGSISKVEFYQGTTLLNSDVTSPYSYSWTNVAAGSYSITAKAYDNVNATTTSTAVNIVVNAMPTVSITSPANNTSFTAPASVTINANAADADGTISKVEFYQGSTLLNSDNASPFSYSWTSVAAGTYSLTAKAYDNRNAVTTSSVVSITVTTGSTCTAQQWNATSAYSGGAVVQYLGIKYVANWWTQGEQPDTHNGGAGSGQPWTSQGTCTSRIAAVGSDVMNLTPNPVDNSSLVTINLPEEDVVKVLVIDRIGREVTEVYKGSLSAGEHRFDLNSTTMAPGIYKLLLIGGKGNLSVSFIKN